MTQILEFYHVYYYQILIRIAYSNLNAFQIHNHSMMHLMLYYQHASTKYILVYQYLN
jgi:hypothetical protein